MYKLIKHMVLNISLLTFVLISFSLFSAAQNHEETAGKLFNDGKYENALPIYQELNVLYPNDENFQYCLGVCLTETNDFSNKARKLLLQASLGNVSPKVHFYIGKNYHAQNNYETANIYYNRFNDYAKKSDKKEVKFYEIWEDCKQNINPFVRIDKRNNNQNKDDIKDNEEDVNVENSKPAKVTNIKPFVKPDSVIVTAPLLINDTLNIVAKDSVIEKESKIEYVKREIIESREISTESPISSALNFADTIFNFILTSNVYYQKINQFKTDEGKQYFINALEGDNKLKKILENVELLRNKYTLSQSQNEKEILSNKVIALEVETIQLKSAIDQNYMNARSFEIKYWNNAGYEEIKQLGTENDSINQTKLIQKQIIEEVQEEPVITDTLDNKTDTLLNIDNPIIEPNSKVIYKIQIGAFSKGLPDYIDRLYKKLSAIRKIDHYTDERGITVYTIGEISDYENAIKLQNQIRQEGVKDAFLVVYNNGKRITLKEANELIKND